MGKFKRTKFPNGNSYSCLTPEQKAFIQNKVEELGSLEQVYTQEQLEMAFNKVKPITHWKDPINRIIEAKDKDIIAAAIIHFTATEPVFSELENTNAVNKNLWLRVQADGYRMGPAGDH
jgi:hypothetical protein